MDFGAYSIAMASLVFGGGKPESIQASGYLTDTAVDELASVIIKYPGIEKNHGGHYRIRTFLINMQYLT